MQKVILYGAGKIGEWNYRNLVDMGEEDKIFAYCDKKADELKEKNGVNVISYEAAKKTNLPFIISISDKTPLFDEVKTMLEKDGIEYYINPQDFLVKRLGYDRVECNRKFCAAYHITSMDEYFNDAESDKVLDVFWGEDSLFLKLFQRLDLTNVVELACGRGRHVPKYIDRAENVTLVDILEKNIDYNKKRFFNYSNISYYKNNGYDLSELPSNEYTSLFCYDAMVHFELIDIYSYLKETYRILVPGGYALIHHSNDSSDYKNAFGQCSNPGGRSFMDKKIFAHLAYRAGFEIVEQYVIDWSEPEMDCITLIRKV